MRGHNKPAKSLPSAARRPVAASALIVTLAACSAGGVSAKDGEWLVKEISRASRGGVVEIPAGDYDIKDLKLYKDVTLRGPAPEDGVAVLRSAETTEKGVLIPLSGVSLRLENLTFRNTSSWDRNGAGVRHEGRDLTIVNCVFDSNEDGILSTGDANGVITITGTTFMDNGFGDGQSHGIYVLRAARLDIQDSKFIGTRIGHHVKSLADETIIRGSLMDDAYGRTSYSVDASKGGAVTIVNNKIIQSADSDNWSIVNYDLTRGGDALSLTIEGNEIINHYNGGQLLRNDTKLDPVIRDNKITNTARKPLKM
ncbi:MAG: right-handed parallel beta-helix repeat-containing protein [Pseudomonadota bacterium]